MLKNFKAMLIAWGAVLTILVGTGVLLEMTYSPVSGNRQDSKPKPALENPASKSSATVTIQEAEADDSLPSSGRFNNEDVDTTDESMTILPPPTFVVVQEDQDLIELGADGLLPKRGVDGKVAWQTYAAPVAVDDARPRIAIIITDMGLNKKLTTAAIEKMPAPVSFAFSPYAVALNEWRNLSRSTGHEVLLQLPMEPVTYPESDPGKLSLLTTNDSLQNRDLLHKVMSKMVGYVGMMNHMGSKFMTSQPNIRPILNEMNMRGLMFVDSHTTQFSKGAIIAQGIGLPRAVNDAFIDKITSENEILIQLQDLENRAKARGVSIGIAHNYPLSINVIQKWIDTLPDQGFQLVPITATVNRQPIS